MKEMGENGQMPRGCSPCRRKSRTATGGRRGWFTPGGSPAFPFGFGSRQKKEDEEGEKGKKGDRKPKSASSSPDCEDLTGKAKAGKLDAIIGRDAGIYRTIQILCRRQKKNNPCLIGEAGVGKTAIAEGIAQHCRRRSARRLRDKGCSCWIFDRPGGGRPVPRASSRQLGERPRSAR